MRHARLDYERFQDPERKIPEDEPVFLIRGQDVVGAATVLMWAELNDAAGGDPKASAAARTHAAKMKAWPFKKKSDL